MKLKANIDWADVKSSGVLLALSNTLATVGQSTKQMPRLSLLNSLTRSREGEKWRPPSENSFRFGQRNKD